MTDVCTCRTIAISAWDPVQLGRDPRCPIHATYTAAEVKVLTETASKVAYELGRREAFSDAIAYQVRIDGDWASFHPSDVRVAFIGPAASGASSDATSGVPGHQEVSEDDAPLPEATERLSKLLPTFCQTCGMSALSPSPSRARCLDAWHTRDITKG